MNPFENFASEINVFLIVALLAVVLSVGGILLLRGIAPPPVAQTPPPLTPSPQPQVLDTSTWQT